MSKRKPSPQPPLWLVIVGGIAAALLAYVGTRGGPEHALREIKEAFGFIEAPKIVSLQATGTGGKTFVVSIENRSLKEIQITGFYAESARHFTGYTNTPGAGPLPVMKAKLARGPAECGYSFWFPLVTPLVIEPESSGGLEITPWREPCDFYLRVVGTSGTSQRVAWTPETDAFLEKLKRSDPDWYREIVRNRQLK